MAKIILKEVGRGKFSGEFEVEGNPTFDQLGDRAYSQVRRHLLSSEIDIVSDGKEIIEGENVMVECQVIVGGFRPVGEVTLIRKA